MAADVSAGGWVQMEHPETGGTARFPDSPGVIEAQEARGWVVAEKQVDPDALDVPEPEPEQKPAKKTAAKKAASSADESKE
jgi:hypothetical protein